MLLKMQRNRARRFAPAVSYTALVTALTSPGDLCHRQLWRGALSLSVKTPEPRLRRAAQFVLVIVLIAAVSAPGFATTCCPRCPKPVVPEKAAPAHSDECSHHMSHPVVLGRRVEGVTHNVRCHHCSQAAPSLSPILGASDGASSASLTDGRVKREHPVLVASLPRMPESPPQLGSTSKQAVICTFLI